MGEAVRPSVKTDDAGPKPEENKTHGKIDDLTSDISMAKSDVAKLKASFDDLHNDINQKVDGFFDVLTSMKASLCCQLSRESCLKLCC